MLRLDQSPVKKSSTYCVIVNVMFLEPVPCSSPITSSREWIVLSADCLIGQFGRPLSGTRPLSSQSCTIHERADYKILWDIRALHDKQVSGGIGLNQFMPETPYAGA